MEAHQGLYYVTGDDSPYLYVLDKTFKEIKRISLTDTAGFGSGRVVKEEKEDLESMTKIELDGETYLLLLGSGSAPARRQAYLISLHEPLSPVVERLSLAKLYDRLQQDKRVVNGNLLNIEGIAAGDGKLHLLQRGLGNGRNVLVTYDLAEFISFLRGRSTAPPAYAVAVFMLQQINGFGAGFSGAYLFDDKLFFTASVESTTNAIEDGEVLGSFVGYIPAAAVVAGTAESASLVSALITQPDGTAFKGKAEAVVVVEKAAAENSYTVLAVTDDDQGHSELLKLRVALGE